MKAWLNWKKQKWRVGFEEMRKWRAVRRTFSEDQSGFKTGHRLWWWVWPAAGGSVRVDAIVRVCLHVSRHELLSCRRCTATPISMIACVLDRVCRAWPSPQSRVLFLCWAPSLDFSCSLAHCAQQSRSKPQGNGCGRTCGKANSYELFFMVLVKAAAWKYVFFFLLPYYAAHSFWLDNYTWHRLLQQLNM